jgi:hypothetical protein
MTYFDFPSAIRSTKYSEMQSYFRSEYKHDAEWAFNNWLESRIAENKKKSFFERCIDLWNLCFPSENELKERYLNEASDLVDLEHRMKQWDQRSRRQNENGVIY